MLEAKLVTPEGAFVSEYHFYLDGEKLRVKMSQGLSYEMNSRFALDIMSELASIIGFEIESELHQLGKPLPPDLHEQIEMLLEKIKKDEKQNG